LSPLLRDAAVLEKKHGYEVDAFGDAKTILVHRGAEYSICDVALGEPCRPVFASKSKVEAYFSEDGTKLAVVSDDLLRVLDGVSGDLLFEQARHVR
jgi:hypothetical protein